MLRISLLCLHAGEITKTKRCVWRREKRSWTCASASRIRPLSLAAVWATRQVSTRKNNIQLKRYERPDLTFFFCFSLASLIAIRAETAEMTLGGRERERLSLQVGQHLTINTQNILLEFTVLACCSFWDAEALQRWSCDILSSKLTWIWAFAAAIDDCGGAGESVTSDFRTWNLSISPGMRDW